jgi:hypothetical protein
MKLNYWCIGGSEYDIMPFNASPGDSVGDLISAAKAVCGWGSGTALVWKVEISSQQIVDYISEGGYQEPNHSLFLNKPLLLLMLLETIFPQLPPKEHLHLVIQPPSLIRPRKFISSKLRLFTL